jgi:hypothetical protein
VTAGAALLLAPSSSPAPVDHAPATDLNFRVLIGLALFLAVLWLVVRFQGGTGAKPRGEWW